MQNDRHIRRVIGGRAYDTETAQFVHVLCNNGGHVALDFHAEYTALYRTRRGAFFVAGESGACGRWKHFRNGGYGPGCGIEVIGDIEARRLLEQANGPVETFFDVIEG
jgi:hypothetical protein